MKETDSFLPALTKSLSELNAQPAMPTAEFCHAMSLILPVFDHLGPPVQAVPLPSASYGVSSSPAHQMQAFQRLQALTGVTSSAMVRRRLLWVCQAGDGWEGEPPMRSETSPGRIMA